MPDNSTSHAGVRGALISALTLCAALLLVFVDGQDAGAQSVSGDIAATEAALSEARQQEGVLTTEVSALSDKIGRLSAEVAELRSREAVVQRELNQKQRELEHERRRLEILQARLGRAIRVLEERLVDIYKSGEPDTITVLLESDGFADLLEQAEYLQRIEDMDSIVVGRVRDLRNETRETVERVQAARDAIARKRRELAETRSALEARTASLESARQAKAAQLSEVRQQRKVLEGDLSELSAKIEEQLSGLPTGPIRVGASGMIWPVNGPITSGFGYRWGRMHEGIDIAVPSGTPIRAALSGSIVLASSVGGYGNYTCIEHGGGLSTCYAHQSSFARTSGSISQGSVLGYVGCTGHCYGDHLHFEVRIDGAAVDPLGYL